MDISANYSHNTQPSKQKTNLLYDEGLMIEAVPNTVTYKVEAKPSRISLINDDAKQSYLFKVLEHAEIIKLITS